MIRDSIRRFIGHTFLPKRFFIGLGFIILLFLVSFSLEILYPVAKALLFIFGALIILDYILVKALEKNIRCERITPKVLPLGDDQVIRLNLSNKAITRVGFTVIDELPVEFQKRDFGVSFSLGSQEEKSITYSIRPLTRGPYRFGNVNVFISTLLGFVQHKIVFPLETETPVYPSSVQVKKHELILLNKVHQYYGIKKIRRIGHSYEFEQIKNYLQGDDVRTINWKATGRRSQLMVNQYGDEKSQQVYSILDKSRAMNMPFNGLSLLDHAVNTTLVISNTAIHKDDKAGILTFNEKMGSFVKADKKPGQLKLISEVLYKETESSLEANYEMLFQVLSRLIKQRSLIILYTNFESIYTLERYLPILRKFNQNHLLLVVIFKNTEIEQYSYQPASDTLGIYQQTIGKKFLSEKEMMTKELTKYGIQSILTAPEDLSTQTINKYLELKAKGWI